MKVVEHHLKSYDRKFFHSRIKNESISGILFLLPSIFYENFPQIAKDKIWKHYQTEKKKRKHIIIFRT